MLHDASFVDAVTRWSACDGIGVTGVDAEFVVENGPADSTGDEGVPIFMDDGGEAVRELSVEVIREANDFVKFGLVEITVPNDTVWPVDGEVERVGGLTKDSGATVRRKEVQVFIDVVGGRVRDEVAVWRFGSPDFGWCVNDEGEGRRRRGPCGKWRRNRRAYRKSMSSTKLSWWNLSTKAGKEVSVEAAVSWRVLVEGRGWVLVSQAGRLSMLGRAREVGLGETVEGVGEAGCGEGVWSVMGNVVSSF